MPVLFGVIGLLVFALDQLTKILALHYLQPGDPVDVIGSFLRFRLIYNSGAAFGLGADYTPIISAIQISVAAAVVWLSRRLGSTGWAVAFGLLFGGAVGNITDRIFRDPSPFHGHVVDFLQLPHWAIFNVADMAVSAAAVLLIVQTMRGVRLDGSRENPSTADGPGADGSEGDEARDHVAREDAAREDGVRAEGVRADGIRGAGVRGDGLSGDRTGEGTDRDEAAPDDAGAHDDRTPDAPADHGAPGDGAQDDGAQDDGAPDDSAPDDGAQDDGAQDDGAPDDGAPDDRAPEKRPRDGGSVGTAQ